VVRTRKIPLVYIECQDLRKAAEDGCIHIDPVECCSECHDDHALIVEAPQGEDYIHPVIQAEVCHNWPFLNEELSRDEWAQLVKAVRARRRQEFAEVAELLRQRWTF